MIGQATINHDMSQSCQQQNRNEKHNMEWRQKENALKVQIAQLEATMKSDLGEKGSIIDRYATERGDLFST